MIYTYQIVYTGGQPDDLTEVNELAKDGWEVIQVDQVISKETSARWFFLLGKKVPPVPEAKQ
jgi:hypothetical protein